MFRCALAFCRCCGSAPLAFVLLYGGFSTILNRIKEFVRDRYSLHTLRGDLFGGIAAAMVMLPISLAYGVLTGLGPLAGMYCAIAVGFFAAVFGGTRSQISGPTGPMALTTIVILSSGAGTVGDVFAIVALAGLIQILMGVIRSGHLAHTIPQPVISGFMTGIGILVILLQGCAVRGRPRGAGRNNQDNRLIACRDGQCQP